MQEWTDLGFDRIMDVTTLQDIDLEMYPESTVVGFTDLVGRIWILPTDIRVT